MEFPVFLRQFLLATGMALLLIGLTYRTPALQEGAQLAWLALAFFLLFNLLIYLLAQKMGRDSRKNRFIQLIMSATFLKMFFSFALIAAYAKIVQPNSKLFALPFFGIYLIFTIFESALLIRAGKR